MTPSDETLELLGTEVVAALLLLTTIVGIVVWALLRAASRKVDIAVIVAVTILTAIAIFGFIVTTQEALITLAGTGLGALAGAITNLISGGNDDADTKSPRRLQVGRRRQDVPDQEAGGQAGPSDPGGSGQKDESG